MSVWQQVHTSIIRLLVLILISSAALPLPLPLPSAGEPFSATAASRFVCPTIAKCFSGVAEPSWLQKLIVHFIVQPRAAAINNQQFRIALPNEPPWVSALFDFMGPPRNLHRSAMKA